ncbi:hypothetical protein [Methylobacter sp.]|uniref:hypothetical protein n=1 Tax=Methylobacter sp. TaxID=2051955 RepID=UPI003DA2196F
MNKQQALWNVARQQGWLRYVVLRHALLRGLSMGIGIPMLNGLYLPPPNFNLLGMLLFSVPFFVIVWGLYGAYSWHKIAKKNG